MVFLSTLFTGFLSCVSNRQANEETEGKGSISGILLAAIRIDLPLSPSSRKIIINARIENTSNEEQEVIVSFYQSRNATISKRDRRLGAPETVILPARQPERQKPMDITSFYTVPTGDTQYSYGYCVKTSSGDSACAKGNVTLNGIRLARTPIDATCPDTIYSSDATQIDSTTSISYTLTFNKRWSKQTHPTNYPSGRNPHFTTLVGASHNDSVVFWQRGGFASAGVEGVAEFGSTRTFLSEIATKEDKEEAIAASASKIIISQDHPLFTMISMLAPSPDWFVGIGGFDMRVDRSEDTFYDEVVIPLRLYDAGTQAGDVFRLSGNGTDTGVNVDMSLRERITRLSTGEEDTDFGNNNNLEGTPCLGTFTVKKQ